MGDSTPIVQEKLMKLNQILSHVLPEPYLDQQLEIDARKDRVQITVENESSDETDPIA